MAEGWLLYLARLTTAAAGASPVQIPTRVHQTEEWSHSDRKPDRNHGNHSR
jgi:hypothetical protein